MKGLPIAIIGMSGLLPQGLDPQECFQRTSNGEILIDFLKNTKHVPEQRRNNNFFVPINNHLPGTFEFDASFFGINPKEAQQMDPQQRKMLEYIWSALEHANCIPVNNSKSISVFSGTSFNTYFTEYLFNKYFYANDQEQHSLIFANGTDFYATKAAYHMNLKGPAININTGCSTSLVAIHLACQSLLTYSSDIAVGGGVSLKFPDDQGYLYAKDGIVSSKGICKPFDKTADGTVFQNGLGFVVLKRLEDALEARDEVYAVIRGSAINNDGNEKVGYMAPSVSGQVSVIVDAMNVAEVTPEEISYVETHGTGTSIGDPIEFEALKRAFSSSKIKNYCAIGSIKANIGHLDAASGVAALLRLSLSLKNNVLPPLSNFKEINDKIFLENTPFYINKEKKIWKDKEQLKIAGISSFGIGGTNAHLILEEPPQKSIQFENLKEYVLVISAKTKESVKSYAKKLLLFLQKNPSIGLSNVSYTLQTARQSFRYRTAIICKNIEEAITKLSSNLEIFDIVKEKQDDLIDYNKKSSKQYADAWLKGKEVDWGNLYSYKKIDRIALPTYAFEKTQYLIKREKFKQKKNEKEMDISKWFYLPNWKRSAYPINKIKKNKNVFLIFADEIGFSQKIINKMQSDQNHFIVIKKGVSFSCSYDSNLYMIDVKNKGHYEKIFIDLYKKQLIPTHIIHLFSVTNKQQSFIQSQDEGLYSIVMIMQSAEKVLNSLKLNITICANKLFNISGIEEQQPEKATLIGASQVIPKEYENCYCKLIDINPLDLSSINQGSLLDEILCEYNCEIAYRGLFRYERSYEALHVTERYLKKMIIQKNKTYLITGGLGNFGLEISDFFSDVAAVNIVLVTRSKFPKKEEWQNWVNTHDDSNTIKCKIQRLQEIEKKGTNICVMQVDVSIKKDFENVLKQTEDIFGDINGVLHAAGIVESGMIKTKTISSFNEIFAAKIYGSYYICELLKNRSNLDFVMLCSSMNAIIGGLGQIDNTAANAFIDALAEQNHSLGFAKVFAVNWGAVNESRARNYSILPQFQELSKEHVKNKMSAQEIKEVYKRTFSINFGPRLVVSTINFQEVIKNWTKVGTLKALSKIVNKKKQKRSETLSSVYVAPKTNYEKKVLEIWEELLGINQIGIEDDFFELGGHSLIAIQFISKITKLFSIKIHAMSIYEYPNVKNFAAYISQLIKEKEEKMSLK